MDPNLPFLIFMVMAFSAILTLKFVFFFYCRVTGKLDGWKLLYFLSGIPTIWFIWLSAQGIIKIAGGI